MPETDTKPMTFEEWWKSTDTAKQFFDKANVSQMDVIRGAFEAGRASGVEEAAAHCDKEVEKIRADPDLLASRDLKIMGMTYGNAANEIRALLPYNEGK